MEDLKIIDKKILGDAYVSNEPSKNLSTLCSFGSRFSGTTGELQAIDFILKKMKEYSLDEPHKEKIDYLGWTRGTTKLEVLEPEKKQLDCIGLPWMSNTPDDGVEAELLNLGQGTYVDYELQSEMVPEKIVMTTAFTPNWMRQQHRVEKLCRAQNLGAVGFIYAKNDPGLLCETGVASWKPPEVLGSLAKIPAVGTSKEVAAYLGRLQKKGPVKLRITASHKSGPAKTWNVVGDIVGRKKPNENIIVGAHFDGHDIAVGAMDDAAGACVVLESARLLAKHKDIVKRTIRFVSFPGEENGDFGSAGYVNNHLDDLDKIVFMFNLDGAGRASRPGVMVQGWPDSIPIFKKIAKDMDEPMPVSVEYSIYSDHMPFSMRGIHTARLKGSNSFRSVRGTRGWGHTRADTEDKVDIRDLREVSAALARILLRLATMDEIPLDKKSEADVREMLEKYGYDEVMEILGSYPSWLK
jgi:hypothetical protein